MNWILHLFSLELRKQMSYRLEFWLNFVGTIVAELFIAYCIWKAIFEIRGVDRIGGYTFSAMIFYYLLVGLAAGCVSAIEYDLIANEIYDGSLSRYLVYPVSFFRYKYATWLATAVMAFLQLTVSVALFLAIFGLPTGAEVSPRSFLLGGVALLGASSLNFYLIMITDMVAFWAENVWSLQVMLRFVTRLLGGGLLPLSLFPGPMQATIRFLPFHSMIGFPIQSIMGSLSVGEWIQGMGTLLFWFLAMRWVAHAVWSRGTRQYSGVGI